MKKFDCVLGVFLSTATPTKPMLDTITNEGFVELETTKQKFPRLQIQNSFLWIKTCIHDILNKK